MFSKSLRKIFWIVSHDLHYQASNFLVLTICSLGDFVMKCAQPYKVIFKVRSEILNLNGSSIFWKYKYFKSRTSFFALLKKLMDQSASSQCSNKWLKASSWNICLIIFYMATYSWNVSLTFYEIIRLYFSYFSQVEIKSVQALPKGKIRATV